MKLNKKVEEVLNKQVNAEFWSAYLYLSMSSWCESNGYKGFANWFKVQYREESAHALKLFSYVLSRTGDIKLQPIDAVETTWRDLLHIFEETYRHECVVTGMIGNCYEVSMAEHDHATASMLKWFIDEQIEEESNALDIIDQLNLVGNSGAGLYQLDKELGARVFVDTTLTPTV